MHTAIVSTSGSVGRLVPRAAACAGIGDAELARFTRRLLEGDGETPRGMRGGVSELNGDGTPLQFCWSSSSRGGRLRVVADPVSELGEPRVRFAAARATLARIAREKMSPQLAEQSMSAVAALVDETLIERYRRGFLWIGASPRDPGAAFYVDLAPPGAAAAWERVARWLSSTLPDATAAASVVRNLQPLARAASAGIEGHTLADARAKIYFRLRSAVPLARLGIAPMCDRRIVAALEWLVGREPASLSGLVLAVGFSLETGAIADAKLDICGHCVPMPAGEWRTRIAGLARAAGVAEPPLGPLLEEGEVAFAGVGVDVLGEARLNVYVKPFGTAAELLPRERRALLRHALDALVAHQNDDGSWRDFLLPVGESTEWVTAYTGLAAASGAGALNHAPARKAALRAAEWLRRHRAYDTGWGYNDVTGPDADSTGFAIRLFRALHLGVGEEDLKWLRERWRRGQGLATFDDRKTAWGHAHPCVTAAGFLAFPPMQRRILAAEAAAILQRTRRADGSWNSYWWRTHHYSTFHHLRLARELGLPLHSFTQMSSVHETALEEVLAFGIDELRRAPAEQRLARLRKLAVLQRDDGTWPPSRDLRVTDPDCSAPWIEPRGALYADVRGIFTTATVAHVLAEGESV